MSAKPVNRFKIKEAIEENLDEEGNIIPMTMPQICERTGIAHGSVYAAIQQGLNANPRMFYVADFERKIGNPNGGKWAVAYGVGNKRDKAAPDSKKAKAEAKTRYDEKFRATKTIRQRRQRGTLKNLNHWALILGVPGISNNSRRGHNLRKKDNEKKD